MKEGLKGAEVASSMLEYIRNNDVATMEGCDKVCEMLMIPCWCLFHSVSCNTACHVACCRLCLCIRTSCCTWTPSIHSFNLLVRAKNSEQTQLTFE